ncbi:MAG: phage holin family protein, partial [Deltaproteobacteria bacterium]
LPYWAAFGIVALANLVTGGTLTWSGTRRVMRDRVDLSRTAEEIRRDRRWLSSMKQGNRPAENALPQPVAIADRGAPSDAASR